MIIQQRVALFRQTGDPSALWPGLTELDRVAALHELERVVRAVLGGVRAAHIDAPNAHSAYALRIAGHTSGTGALIGQWLISGLASARADVAAAFREQLAHSGRRAERMSREAAPAIDALIACGAEPVALRGFHTSRAYFEVPGMRRMADIDILVQPEMIARAESALRAGGFTPASAPLRPYKRDWIGAGVSTEIMSVERDDERNKWILELHASLDRVFHPGAVARLDSENSRVETINIGGHRLRVLAAPVLLLTLACHCSQELDSSRLLRLVEIVRVIRAGRATGRLDWNEFPGMLRRTGAARYAYPAFALAEELAPGTIDARVLNLCRRESTWAARHTVARMVPAGGSPDQRGALRQLMWTRGTVAIAQRAMRNIWPASFTRPGDVVPGWRTRLRRIRAGLLSLRAPDERRV
jgi:hypothetical protein